jgi:hypothetical protein
MAASTTFKQQCPSCEAMVSIKDSSMVGKKVDCPKCKYRFVVEDPGTADGDEPEKKKTKSENVTKTKPSKAKTRPDRGDDDDDGENRKPKAKKKSGGGGSAMLYVGIGLGVVAVIGMVVLGYVLFFSGGNNSSASNTPTKQQPANTTPSTQQAANNNNNNAGGNTDNTQGGGDKNTDPGDGSNQANITNLLPGTTEEITNVPMGKFLNCSLGGAMFRSSSGFQPDTIRDAIGLPMDKMSRFLRAENIKQGWVFNIIQMYPSYTISGNDLKTKLGSKKGEHSPIKKHEYYLTSANEVLDSIGSIDASYLTGQKMDVPQRKRPNDRQLAWHLYDPQTLIIADIDMMEQFLQANRQPPLVTKSTEGSGTGPLMPGGNPPPVIAQPPGGGRGGPAGGMPSGSPNPGGNGPPNGMMPPGGMPGGMPNFPGGPSFSEKNTYMTVSESLKSMMDRLEDSKTVIFSSATSDVESASAALVNIARTSLGVGALPPLPTITCMGVGLHVFSEARLAGVFAVEMKREDDARTNATNLQTLILPVLAKEIGKYMDITVSTGAPSNFPPGVGMMPPNMAPPMGVAQPPIGANGPRPVMPAPGGVGPNPMNPFPGGNPFPSGSPIPGGSPTPPPAGLDTPNTPGGTPATPTSTIRASSSGKLILVNFDLEVNSATDQKLRNSIESQVIQVKGMLDVQTMTQPRWHELANTANSLRAAGKVIKPNLISGEGQVAFGGTSFISRPPAQRVSWMAELLPFLGKDDLFRNIDPKQPWRSENNLKVGGNWIPQFINPQYPRSSWQAHLPSLPGQDMGATHYVGLSGIGLESAEYMAGDPNTAKKLGMFGYNRETKISDIKDGLSNTIYMIQVPPTLQRPWIAGGGATIQGVPETKSIAPFVYQQANGKKGTYALMADGSVRFIADTIPDDVFKSMVTIAGEDDASQMESHTQKIPPGGAPVKPLAPAAPPMPPGK